MSLFAIPPGSRVCSAALSWGCALALAAVGQVAAAADSGNAAIVGEATLVIGQARLFAPDGSMQWVERGSAVRVGDRIETQPSGHVHLRFVDGGMLSVRPASRLQIEDYSHSPNLPTQGAIKFRLDEGVVRSITGSWGEAARERFRLNTPVAAIGVKGTDFVVKTEGDKTTASVFTGAILVTPLGGGCLGSVGPCINGREKLLSDDMKGQMLELSRQQSTPILVPVVDLLARNARPPASVVAAASASVAAAATPPTDNAAVAPSVVETQVASNASSASASVKTIATEARSVEVVAPTSVAAATPAPEPVKQPISTGPAPEPAKTPATTGPVPTATAPVVPAAAQQLFWQRSSDTPPIGAEEFSKTLEQALASGYQRLQGDAGYALYRAAGSAGAAWPSAGLVDFRLTASAAQWQSASQSSAETANLRSGTFSVDFGRASFATQLDLDSPGMGQASLNASGVISKTGELQAKDSDIRLAGALSLDGREAAYHFNKTVNNGLLRGLTLWGR